MRKISTLVSASLFFLLFLQNDNSFHRFHNTTASIKMGYSTGMASKSNIAHSNDFFLEFCNFSFEILLKGVARGILIHKIKCLDFYNGISKHKLLLACCLKRFFPMSLYHCFYSALCCKK